MNITRGLFRLWVIFSIVWVAAMSVAVWPPISTDRQLPTECNIAKTAKECSDILENLGQGPFGGYFWGDDLQAYRDGQRAGLRAFYLDFAEHVFLPPAMVLIIGMGLMWAFRGFRQTSG